METISKASHEWSPAFKFRILSPRKTLSHDNTIFRLSPKFRACEALWERSIPRRSGTTYLFYYPAQTSLGNSLYHASSHRRALVAPCGEKLVPITGKNCDALVICFPFLCVYFFRIFLQESIRRLNSLQYGDQTSEYPFSRTLIGYWRSGYIHWFAKHNRARGWEDHSASNSDWKQSLPLDYGGRLSTFK